MENQGIEVQRTRGGMNEYDYGNIGCYFSITDGEKNRESTSP